MKYLLHSITLFSLLLCSACAEIKVNTLPPREPTAKLRVYIQPITNISGNIIFKVPHNNFAKSTIKNISKQLQQTGIYEIVSEKDIQLVIGEHSPDAWELRRSEWELARKIGQAMQADYLVYHERGNEGPITFYLETGMINVATGTKFIQRERLSWPWAGDSEAWRRAGQNNINSIFHDSKNDLLATAVKKNRLLTKGVPQQDDPALVEFARQEQLALEQQRLKNETERLAAEKVKAVRLAELKAEQERLARENEAAKKAATAKLEAERVAREKAEQERLAKEKQALEAKEEAERLARENAEKVKLTALKAEQVRIERENETARKAAAAQMEAARVAREKAEAARIAAEKAEQERFAREKQALAAREEAEKAAREKASAGKQSTVSTLIVYDLAAVESLQPVAAVITEALREELFQIGYILVNRENLNEVMQEQKFKQSGIIEIQDAGTLAKALSADNFIVGRVGLLGKSFIVQTKRIDARTLKTLGISSLKCEQGREEEILSQLPAMAKKLGQP
jgi:chemotaxis protein histidine kinase CheA